MGRYCYGAFLKVLSLCSPRSTTNKFLCGTMFLAVNGSYDIRDDDGAVAHLINCSNNVSPSVTDNIATVDATKIRDCFEKEIIPKLYPDKLKHAVSALQTIFLLDESIDEDCPIGVLNPTTKCDYRLECDFVLADFLTDFFIFSISGIANKSGAPFIKEIDSDFIDSQGYAASNITLSNKSVAPLPALSKTLRGKDFHNVFTQVSSAQIGIKGREELKIFRLNIEDNLFSYTGLRKLLNANIGRYVFSRVMMENYKKNDDLESVGGEAAHYMRDHMTGSELGDMLLYAFMEEILNAPKILSSIELGDTENRCAGIHFYTVPGTKGAFQLVYGASTIKGDLRSAIDDAFLNVEKMKDKRIKGDELVNSNAFNRSVDRDTALQIKLVLLPSKKNRLLPSTAFGIFLGYTLGLNPEDYTEEEFYDEAIKQMEQDIQEQAPYILTKIKSLRMGMHSFYIYVLPFNDADSDKNDIIDKLIGGAAS